MKDEFDGRIAMVTAASRGIGFGVAEALARRGAALAICARGAESLDKAAGALRDLGAKVYAAPGDVGDAAFLDSFALGAEAALGRGPDILVNNNGGPPAGDVFSRTEAMWREALDRNFLSVVRLCALVAPGMKARGWGRIVNLTSLTAKEPDGGMVLSSTARAAVAAYSKTLAGELGPFGVTVNTVLTGGVLTERAFGLIRQEIAGTDETLEKAVARIGATLPVRHLATPGEFAKAVLFLCADASSYVTGVALPIDGGASHTAF
jgi:3-oxoacyl-[acyl-carrier protein] reductase